MFKRRKQQFEIDYDKLADAIVKAQEKADKETIKQAVIDAQDELYKRETEQQEAKKKEWQQTLGDDNLKAFFKILFIKKDEAKTLSANITIMKMLLIGIYYIFEAIMYFLIIGFIIVSFLEKTFFSICFASFFLVIGVLIARIIRIARFEVEHIDDNKYLTTLFSSMLSLLAVIIAVVSVVITQK